MTDTAPIALFTYARPDHTRRTVEALQRNYLAAESDLYVFSDGPKSSKDAPAVEALRRYLESINGFRSITIRARSGNAGLSTSIIEGVTDIVTRFGRVVVVEDDIVTSPLFLAYMNSGLTLYEHDSEVVSIHGYMYPHREMLPSTFFLRGADCWGWATWSRGWDIFRPDGTSLLAEIKRKKLEREFNFKHYPYTEMLRWQVRGWVDSWAIRWYASAFLLGGLTLYPGKSLVQNIGLDGSGTHASWTAAQYGSVIATEPVPVRRIPLVEDPRARREVETFFLKLRVRKMVMGGWALILQPRAYSRALRRTIIRTLDRSARA